MRGASSVTWKSSAVELGINSYKRILPYSSGGSEPVNSPIKNKLNVSRETIKQVNFVFHVEQ